MKYLRTMLILGLLAGGALSQAWAAPPPSSKPVPTSVPTVPSGTATPGASSLKPNDNPVHYVSSRVRDQLLQIQKELKAKKITQAQATSLRAQVMAIRKQELAYLKSNGNSSSSSGQGKTLTPAQTNDLASQLDANSKSIPAK